MLWTFITNYTAHVTENQEANIFCYVLSMAFTISHLVYLMQSNDLIRKEIIDLNFWSLNCTQYNSL